MFFFFLFEACGLCAAALLGNMWTLFGDNAADEEPKSLGC